HSSYTCPGRSPSRNEHRLAHVLFHSRITPLHASQLSAASPHGPHAAHGIQLNFHQTVRIHTLVLNVVVVGLVSQPHRQVNVSRVSRSRNVYPHGRFPLSRFQ